MKYQIKRYLLQNLLLIVGILFLAYLKQKGSIESSVFVGLMAGGLTAFISSITHFNNTDKFFYELFKDFNSRYDLLNGFLNQISPDKPLAENDRQKVIDYLNLSAEEFMWVKKARIPPEIWNAWKNGIKVNLENKAIKQVFDDEMARFKNSYYGFFEEMDMK